MHEDSNFLVNVIARQYRILPFSLLQVRKHMQRTASTRRRFLQERRSPQNRPRRIPGGLCHLDRLEKAQQRLFVGRHAAKSVGDRIRRQQYNRRRSAIIHILQQRAGALEGDIQLGFVTSLNFGAHRTGVINNNDNRLPSAQAQDIIHSRNRQAGQGQQKKEQQQRPGRQ